MMTPRARMLAACKGRAADAIPIAPEFWYYIKDFERDWPVYAEHFFVPPEELDWTPVQQALDAVGEDYLLEIYIGDPFIDFAGEQREGGLDLVVALAAQPGILAQMGQARARSGGASRPPMSLS